MSTGGSSTGPLLDLPPVALPPPPAASSETGVQSLAGRALLSVLLLIGVLVIAVGLILFMVGVNLAVWRLGRVNIGLVLATFAIVAALGRAVLTMLQQPEEAPDEVEVPRSEEPELYAEIDQLADLAGSDRPDRIVVIADTNAYVSEFGPLLGLVRGRRTLAIGVPLLDAFDVSELR